MPNIIDADMLSLFGQVDEYIESQFETWRSWRRHLHSNPELSWEEVETTRFIRKQLKRMGLDLVPGPQGLGGWIDLRASGTGDRWIAYRGDIDAIPVHEETGHDFCSQNPGVMHACGHDVHTTVALGVCDTIRHVMSQNLFDKPLNLRVIFQPAEEVAQGAAAMMDLGVLEDIDCIFAMHVDASREVGQIGYRDGPQTACSEEIRVQFEAEGGHSARPHETADPLFAATQFINAAYASVPRITDPRRAEVLTFCHIEGGQFANVIPAEVKIRGTLRTVDPMARQRILSHLEKLAVATTQTTGVQVTTSLGVASPSVVNNPAVNQLLVTAARTFLPDDSIQEVEPSLGGEDFAFYQKDVPGALLRVGSARGERGRAHLHSPHFDVDEEVIRVAVALFTRSILKWAQG